MIDTKALRSRILDLAIQGKLTEQLPSDGTAEELYQQIQAEKQRFISNIKSEDIPFDIPSNWKWVRLGEIVSILGGKRIPAGRSLTTDNTGHKYIRVSDMKNMSVETSNLLYVPEDIYPKISRYIINKEDVYITVAGTIGRVGTIPDEIDGANLTENADRLVFTSLEKNWLVFTLSADTVQKQISYLTTQVAQPKLAIKKIQEFILPLPPLAEQKRIVERVEEIFRLLDTIDQAQKKYSADSQILKAKLITAGIQGKLTKQLPSDGTAEELYQQIQTEKQKLIKEGKLKKEKPLPPVSPEEVPFEIPENWIWVRLIDIVQEKPTNGYSPKGVNYITDIKNLTLTATSSGTFKPDEFKYVDIPLDVADKYWLKKDDILIQRSNSLELVGTSCIFDGEDNTYIYPDLIMRMHLLNDVAVEYISFVLKSDYIRKYYIQNATGASSSMPKINQQTVSMTQIPLPPLAEQKRIAETLEKVLGALE